MPEGERFEEVGGCNAGVSKLEILLSGRIVQQDDQLLLPQAGEHADTVVSYYSDLLEQSDAEADKPLRAKKKRVRSVNR